MNNSFSLEEFKSMNNNQDFKNRITGRVDSVDFDNGSMVVYAEHLNKYLEKYSCKDASDLEDTLWFNYGVYLKIVE